MDELIDTVGERITHKLHKLDTLNQWEAGAKQAFHGVMGDVTLSGKVTLKTDVYARLPSFGKAMMPLFTHTCVNLDSASFGCCPRPVLDSRAEWEQEVQYDPVVWRFKSLNFRIMEASAKMAHMIQADPRSLFVCERCEGRPKIINVRINGCSCRH